MYLLNKLKHSSLLLLLPLAAGSQPASTYIAPGASIHFFGNISIWGDMENNGSIATDAGQTISFYGQNWKNGSAATFPVLSGTGGTIQFIQPRPVPYANNVIQTLDGGYTSGAEPSFPNLDINNGNNITQLNTDARVKNNLNFTSGKAILNARDLILGSTGGNGGAGTITNYDQNRYAVTNSTGHLVKELYSGPYTFPVGMSATDYTPAAVDNTVANGIHVNVTNYASSAAPRGASNNGIDRTWNIYADVAAGNSNIDLQHNNATNQATFLPSSHFVSRYVGSAPNTAGDNTSTDAWEKNTAGPGSATGTLTTGPAIANASERSRAYTTLATSAAANSAYYTKASGEFCVKLRVYLEGSLMNNGNAVASDGRPLMRDDLRNSPHTGLNYIPVRDPYEFNTSFVRISGTYAKLAPQNSSYPQFQQISNPTTVFNVAGQEAIVDWAFVELRSKSDNSIVQATRAGLLQRDGDIVDLDGLSCLSFPGIALDSYFVAVRHRSHLGTMTKYGQSATNLQNLVDLTVTSTPLYDFGSLGGFNFTGLSQKPNVKGTYRAMWQGDFNADGKVKYDNPDDDLANMLFDVRRYPGNTNSTTNYDFAYGYFQSDYDMDSKVKFDNPDDDNALLLFTLRRYPLNTNRTTSFDFMLQQLP